ncbi:hypothetical protein [Halalkalibacter hemicellulosilyticus]|nr:hypothetical protein [Halalkalibacter hemicellulosilyticus]
MNSKQLEELLLKIYDMGEQQNVKVKEVMTQIAQELNHVRLISGKEKEE